MAYGTSLSSWLTHRFPMPTRAARRLVQQAHVAAGRPATMVAVQQGTVRPEQALAVCDVMSALPVVDPITSTEVEAVLLDWATTMTPNDLRSMGSELVERLDPDHADALLGRAVERQHRRADRDRRLVFTAHPDGSTELYACGPSTVLEPLVRQIEAEAAQTRRAALENLDDTLPRVTATQRRFDALVALSSRVAAFEAAPVVAGDRPRVVVHITTDQLTGLAETNRITGVTTDAGVPVPASVARRWLCDSALQPLVTDPTGRHTLGVGRAHRLATPALRTALALRDRGCVFPGCDVAAHLCDAHHVQPWWTGGTTDLDNLALLCPHHHGLLEPNRRHPQDQWTIVMSADGYPSVYAPVRIDPLQKPRRHQRPNPTVASRHHCVLRITPAVGLAGAPVNGTMNPDPTAALLVVLGCLIVAGCASAGLRTCGHGRRRWVSLERDDESVPHSGATRRTWLPDRRRAPVRRGYGPVVTGGAARCPRPLQLVESESGTERWIRTPRRPTRHTWLPDRRRAPVRRRYGPVVAGGARLVRGVGTERWIHTPRRRCSSWLVT